MRELYGRRRLPRRLPGRVGGGGAAASTSTTCSRDRRRRWRLRRHVRRHLRRPAAAPADRRGRPRGADVETERDDRLHRRRSTASRSRLRLTSDAPCPDCSRHRRQARHPAARSARSARAPASWSTSVGGAFSMNETCPRCGGRQLVYDEPCPTCHGSGRGLSGRTIQARIPAGVKDGQRIRLRGKGARRRERRPGRRPVRHRARSRPHRLFGRKGDNLTLDVPVSLRRGRARRRDQGPDARRRAR